jgi:hypothetical protein
MKINQKKWSLVLILLMMFSASTMSFAQTHEVVSGDTLWDLGVSYGVPWEDIAGYNGIEDVLKLGIGTTLAIPDGSRNPQNEVKAMAKEGYMEYHLSIPNGDYEIPAIVTLPMGGSSLPAVVMLHGTGSDKHEAGGGYDLMAPAFAEAGIASIRIDFIGTGESQVDYIKYNYTTAVSDAVKAMEFMQGISVVDPTRIGVMGWSQGGTIALLAAAHNRSFQSVLTWAGAPDLTVVGDEAAYQVARDQGYSMLEYDWRSPLKLGLQWFDEVYATDVLEVFSHSDAPVLAVNGAMDTTVDPVNAEWIVAASADEDSRVALIQGADHTFNIFTGDMTAFEELMGLTADWFVDTLAPVYTEEVVMMENDGRLVPATIVVPEGEGPFPAVVMNHGHGGGRQENGGFAGVAEALADRGILSIRMDFPGTGDSAEPFTDNILSKMIADSNAGLANILENYPVDDSKLGIMGYSMGGRIALHIGSEEGNPYRAMALLAPSADWGYEMMVSFLGGEEAYEALYLEAATTAKGYADFTTIWGQTQTLSLAWFDEMLASRPLEAIDAYQGDMLVVYGLRDTTVPPAVNEAVLAAYTRATGVTVAEADHGYGFYSDQPVVTAAVEDSIGDFFLENLK